jgi:uracil-DNA glycosylase
MSTNFVSSFLPVEWYNVLRPTVNSKRFDTLQSWLKKERNHQIIYPPEVDVFNAYKFCAPSQVKVVILGQDPYHGENQGHGLSFSVKKGVRQPPSLKNIFKELESDVSVPVPDKFQGELTSWANQGVFLLNTVLTVTKSKPDSHKNKGWEEFTDATIQYISDNNKNVVFILWGAKALKKTVLIDHNKHLVLTSFHPSPFSARKGFFGSKPFSKTNSYLISTNQKPINWEL